MNINTFAKIAGAVATVAVVGQLAAFAYSAKVAKDIVMAEQKLSDDTADFNKKLKEMGIIK